MPHTPTTGQFRVQVQENVILESQISDILERSRSAVIPSNSNYIPITLVASHSAVQPHQHVPIEFQHVNNIKRSSSTVTHLGSCLLQSSTDQYSQKLSESCPNLHSIPTTSPCATSNSVRESSSYSHIFQGRFLHTMRRVSTSAHLPCPNDDVKPRLIYVKPVNTMEQI